MKVGMFIRKVKIFGISWCIPQRMAADNAKGGLARPPSAPYRVNANCIFFLSENVFMALAQTSMD